MVAYAYDVRMTEIIILNPDGSDAGAGGPLLSVRDYADHVKVNHRTVRDWLARGLLPDAFQDTRRVWWIPADARKADVPVAPRADIATTSDTQHSLTSSPEWGSMQAFAPKRRPFPIADVAAAWDLPVETIRRWAREGVGGLELATGPHNAHYVWVESA